ncbi:hypothetical protein [Megasphaera elsdenii]|uniref:hypothetical protein n=1 Tax=Megasphaera elsdenii TaxID=907 RepID=UPI0024313A4D|nr:hypothetical protein [Megasphaera elsdenii]
MADMTTAGTGGYSRIQHSIDTAARWEKYNPAIRPGELIIVKKPDGKTSVKVNTGDSDIAYNDVKTVWDEGVADQLRTNLTDTKAAANSAVDAKNSAQEYAQQAEATANAIKEKEILSITDSVQLAINTEDGGLDIVVTTE